jgi:thiol-disulfide isomerase/thioredoxin
MIIIFLAIFIPVLASASIVALDPQKDCDSLGNHKVLFVHASWCHYCTEFMPTYIHYSDDEKYKSWTFYTYEPTNVPKGKNPVVCGHAIYSVPAVFVNNTQIARSDLQTYLDRDK